MDAATTIETLVIQFVRALAGGRLSSVAEAAADAGLAPVLGRRKRARDGTPAESQLDTSPEAAERRVRRIVAEWSVLGLAHQLLRSGRTCTIRDLYYCGAGSAFRSQEDAGRAIQSVCNVLGTHRHRLGLHASARGLVVLPPDVSVGRDAHGAIAAHHKGGSAERVVQTPGGKTDFIPPWIVSAAPILSGRVAFVLVVEKDCIFHRLAQDGLPQKSRCAMVTGKGMPDLAARAMTWRLATRFKCPVLALTDCNPAGMNVALAFKLACKSSTLPSADEEQFKVPQMAWLGLSPFDLDVVDPSAVLPLSSRDRTLAANLAARDTLPPSWAGCAKEMLDADRKAELEALYTSGGGVGGVMAYVLRKLRDQEWLL